MKSARADFHFRLVQARNLRIGFAADRDQDFVEDFFLLLDCVALESHANSVGFFFHGFDSRVQQDSFENLLHPLVQREDQIAVRARK